MHELHRFGAFELRPRDRLLLVRGEAAALKPRALDLLCVLVEHRGRVLSSDELLRLAWPRLAVGESALQAEIEALRGVIGAKAITGGGGHGYQFRLDVTDGPGDVVATRNTRSAGLRPKGTDGPMASTPHRKLVAVLSADVFEYSRMMGEDEEATLDAILLTRARVKAHVAEHGGRLVDATGDALLAEFVSALEAVRCAWAFQVEQAQRNARLPLRRQMRLRIGLNVGDVLQHDAALYGDGINIAARVQALGEPGGVCIAGAVFDQVQHSLGALCEGYRFGGEQTVKNIATPVRIYHLGAEPPDARPPGPAAAEAAVYRFDDCEVRPAQRQVLVSGEQAKVGARALDILLVLIEQRNRVVSKAELFERVWPRSVVVEGNLQVHVFALRKLLGPNAIATIPGRGYRFAAALKQEPTPAPPAPAVAIGPVVQHERDRAFKTNLPEALPPLIGRDDDVAALGTLLGEQRLITITAAGGMGKTRLAQRLAFDRRSSYRDGVCWVDLSGLEEPRLVPSAVAAALGIELKSDDAVDALLQALKGAHVLIVLDNAEHLLDAAAHFVTEALARTKDVSLLVTSQAAMRVAQERQYRLDAMALPDGDDLAPEDALSYGAIAMFTDRARAADRHFALDEHTVRPVIEVCRQLDAMPLAIEMAAARVSTIGLGRLVHSLNERLRVLTGGKREAPQRQKTLRATLQWSYSLLQPLEMRVFRSLGVFKGGFSLELAQRVAADPQGTPGDRDDPPIDKWAVLDHLSTLADRSLVAVEQGEYPRYRLLETARLFALEQLEVAAQADAVRRRHAEALCEAFNRIDASIWDGSVRVDDAIAAFEPDLDNARAALSWAAAHDPTVALSILATLEHALTMNRRQELDALWALTEPLFEQVGDPAIKARWALGCARIWPGFSAARGAKWADYAAREFGLLGTDINEYLARVASFAARLGIHLSSMPLDEIEQIRSKERPGWPAYVLMFGPRIEAMAHAYADDVARAEPLAQRWVDLAKAAGCRHEALQGQGFQAELLRIAGRHAEAIDLQRRLLAQLGGFRDLGTRSGLEVNLFGDLVLANELEAARALARTAWNRALASLSIQHWWACYAALLAAREGRAEVAAQIIGWVEQFCADHEVALQTVERRAVDLASEAIDAQVGREERQRLEILGRSAPFDALGDLGGWQ